MRRTGTRPVARRLASVAIGALVSLGAHTGTEGQERIASDSVHVFRHSELDRRLPWRAVELWGVGGTPGSNLEVYFRSTLEPWDIDADSTGTVYIADETQIYVVSPDGRNVRVVGRSGQGPGEFSSVVFGLDVSADTALVVRVAGGLVRWRLPDLTLLPSIRIGPVLAFEDLRMERDGFLFTGVSRTVLNQSMVRDTNQLMRWGGDTIRTVFVGASHEKNQAGADSPCFPGILFSKLFAPTLVWDRGRDVLAVANDDSYTIHLIFDTGRQLRIERDKGLRKVTEEMALREAALDDALIWGPPGEQCTTTPAEAVRQWGYSEYVQPVQALRLVPGGYVWALRGRVSDEPYAIDVFTTAGEYLGTLDGMPMPVAFGPSGRMVVTETDELGVQSVKVYQLSDVYGVAPW